MTFLPIADRELRVAARRRNTFWTRLAAAGIGVLISAWALVMAYMPGFGNLPGQLIFSAVSSIAFYFCLLGGLFKTADSLSEEKREGTLGLLFLTDLRGYDVVVGKLVATSLLWFYGLLAVFPILATSLLLGGVAPGEFWRHLLALVNLLFVSLAVGLLVSAISRNERRAMIGAALTLFLLFNVPRWLGQWQKKATGALEISPVFLVWNPGHSVTMASDGMYLRRAGQFWIGLFASNVEGWICIALASLLVLRSWQDPTTTARGARWQERQRCWRLGRPAVREAFRKQWLSINPFLWMAARERWKTTLVYSAIFVAVAYFALGWLSSDRTQPGFIYDYTTLGVMMAAIFKVWVAFEACRRFVEDRRSGALELLLCTPLGVEEIIRGQWRALRRQFAGPAILILALAATLLGLRLNLMPSMAAQNLHETVLAHVAWAIVFVADLFALARLGMWFGLTSRHVYTAAGKALLWIQVMPWVTFYFSMTPVMLLLFRFRLGSKTGPPPFFGRPEFYILMWFSISMLFAVVLARWAWRKLPRDFRECVVALPKTRKRAIKPPLLPAT